MSDAARRDLWKAIGPGVLFAGAAVGVSHLVQSTRAGASYGLALVSLVIVANVVKYPAFRFGPHYAAATGTSLLEGYRRLGRWALLLYGALTLATMFTVLAAVTLVTAGLLIHLGGATLAAAGPLVVSAALVIGCAAVLAVGRFAWLDRIGKVVVGVLALTTVVATVIALSGADLSTVPFAFDLAWLDDTQGVFFMAALVGWMPSAIDVSVWQSLWTLSRADDTGHRPTVRQSMVDFHAGYVGTAILGVCFVVLGAAVMYGRGEIPGAPAAFAGRLVDLYGETLGGWSRPLIAIAAFLTMLSTTLTVVDGFPRALSVLAARFRRPEGPGDAEAEARGRAYWIALFVLAAGGLGLLYVVLVAMADGGRGAATLRSLVDLATTLSFLTAPVLSVLNHRCIVGAEVPEAHRPAKRLLVYSAVGIAAQAAFALYYLYIRFLG